jgi:hypothetical protein
VRAAHAACCACCVLRMLRAAVLRYAPRTRASAWRARWRMLTRGPALLVPLPHCSLRGRASAAAHRRRQLILYERHGDQFFPVHLQPDGADADELPGAPHVVRATPGNACDAACSLRAAPVCCCLLRCSVTALTGVALQDDRQRDLARRRLRTDILRQHGAVERHCDSGVGKHVVACRHARWNHPCAGPVPPRGQLHAQHQRGRHAQRLHALREHA